MSNLRDLNSRSNPVADILQAITAQAQEHPFFAAYNPEARDRGDGGAQPPDYEDPPASVPDGAAGPPSSFPEEAPPPPPPDHGAAPPPPPGHGPLPHRHSHRGRHHGPHHGSHHGPPPHDDDPFSGHFSFGGPGGFGGHGGSWGGFGRHGGSSRGWGGGWGGRGGGRCGGRRGGNPWGGQGENFDMSKIGDFISQFAPGLVPETSNNKDGSRAAAGSKDYQPPADIFDTQDAFIVHVSLPGAKKEDVGVNWDADKSELSVAGVIYRPADEETLKTLALDEREVGAFERKVALGTKLSPAQVDAEGISAKMEDGVLIVNIPKLEQDFVEVKKVEVE